MPRYHRWPSYRLWRFYRDHRALRRWERDFLLGIFGTLDPPEELRVGTAGCPLSEEDFFRALGFA